MREFPRAAKLKDGRTVQLRPLAKGDFEELHAFFLGLSEDDRLFLQHDVTDPGLVRKWTENIDLRQVVPIIASDGAKIVGDGTLHIPTHGWSQHVGLVRLMVARTHRDAGLGTLVARELVAVAEERGLEKLQANVMEDDEGTFRMFEAMGFCREAVVSGMVKDRQGKKHNLAIMINNVSDLERTMEDWIHDTMIPAFRVPGAGN